MCQSTESHRVTFPVVSVGGSSAPPQKNRTCTRQLLPTVDSASGIHLRTTTYYIVEERLPCWVIMIKNTNSVGLKAGKFVLMILFTHTSLFVSVFLLSGLSWTKTFWSRLKI